MERLAVRGARYQRLDRFHVGFVRAENTVLVDIQSARTEAHKRRHRSDAGSLLPTPEYLHLQHAAQVDATVQRGQTQGGQINDKASVLIVAQPKLFRRTLKIAMANHLQAAAFEEAGTGIEALSIAAARRPAIAIVDPLVPGGAGLAPALYLNDTGCVVVLLHRPLNRASIMNYLQAGVRAFVDPDCTPDELVRSIERALAGEIVLGARISGLLAATGDGRTSQAGLNALSRREREVVRQVALGKSNLEIARDLAISANTVKGHLVSIFSKLQVSNRVQVTTYAIENGLTEEPLQVIA